MVRSWDILASTARNTARSGKGGRNQMFNLTPKAPITGDVAKAHRMPRARTLGMVIVAGYITFVLLYLLLWETHPDWQMVLNRISWSSSDFVGVAAVALGLYSYMLFEKFDRNKDIQYLQEFALELKKMGIKPTDMEPIINAVKPLFKQFSDDPEFQAKLQRVMARIAKERTDGLKKLSEGELYELFRSVGNKL